jgi:hypothetical protein
LADAVKELVIRIVRDDAQALAGQRAYHAAEKKGIQQSVTDARAAEKAKADAAKAAERAKAAAAKSTLAATRQAIAESKRLERELFDEGKRLAAEAAAREKRDAANAVASAKLAYGEKKKQLDAQTRATEEASAATQQMTRTLLGTQVAGAALNLVKTGIDAIAQSAADAKARIQAMNAEAAAARHSDREIAALTGNKATVAFSATQAGEAAQAGVSPAEYRAAQLAFQAQAGQYIGEGEHAKISGADSKDLLQRVASFSAAQGIDASDPARLMGAIISKGQKGESNASRLATFGKAFKALQLAPGETSPLVGQLTELIQEEVGQGGSFKNVLEAVPLIRSMAERNPGEASTYGRSLIRGLREVRSDPKKMAELGITKDMDFMQQVRAVEKSASAVGAAGGDEGEFLSNYFKDIRQFGAVRTALGGVRGKSPEMIQAEMAGVNEGTVNADILGYRTGEEGRAQAAASRETQAKLEQASNPGRLLVQEMRARASTSLEASGELNKGEGLGAILTNAGRMWGLGDRKAQEETALVGAELRQRLEGYAGGRKYLRANDLEGTMTGLGSRMTPESTLIEVANVLAQFRDAAKAIKEGGDAIKQAKPPVAAPAPAKPAPGPGRIN